MKSVIIKVKGPAGSGKTFTMDAIREALEPLGFKFVSETIRHNTEDEATVEFDVSTVAMSRLRKQRKEAK